MFAFNETKATQVASLLLRLRGGTMHYLKLVKLLYFVDRQALIRWGRTVTTDRHVSMDKGPVVSRIYELICDEQQPGEESVWRKFISAPESYKVSVLASAATDELSPAERRLIEEIYGQYGHQNRWKLVEYAHTLPEWRNPHGSSLPISPADILSAGGLSPQEVEVISRELEDLCLVSQV